MKIKNKILGVECKQDEPFHIQTVSFSYCMTNLTEDDGATVTQGYLVCFPDNESNELMYVVKAGLMIVSIVFLLLTLYIYNVIPDLRQTLDRVTAYGVASLLFFMTFLSMVQFQFVAKLDMTCRVIGN
jgi:hypothetical protein